MPAITEIPRVFFFLDRTYCYPTLRWSALDGKKVQVEKMFLTSGATVSGNYILRVIASPMHGRVDLLSAEGPPHETSWVMLTDEEAQLVITGHLTASPFGDSSEAAS